MKRVFALSSFERSIKRLSPQDKDVIAESLEAFNLFLLSGRFPAGLGLKKIDSDKYEFRASLRLRVIIKVDRDDYYLVLAGNHDDIRNYLRRYRK